MKISRLNDLIEDSKTTKGKWRLTPNHEIQYHSKGRNEEYKLSGNIVAVEPGAILFSVTKRQEDQKVVTSIHRLLGTWKLNQKNQILFEVEKERGKNDVLTFKGAWEVNKNHEIVYSYETRQLKRKTKVVKELVYKGHWDIFEKNRLTYLLSGAPDSAFRFRGAFQTPSILAKHGEIRYQAGAEVHARHKIRTIALFGKWKLSRDLSLDFEIEYADGRKKAITFGGDFALNHSTQIAVNLKSRKGQTLGIELLLTKDILGKDGQAFMRLQKTLEESRVEAGMSFKW